MWHSFKYRAKLSKETEANCNQWIEQCRILYNLALEQRISVYDQSKKSVSYFSQSGELPELRKAFPEFKQVDAQCLSDVLDRLDKATQLFFRRVKSGRGEAGYPRFKSRGRYSSFTLLQNSWKLRGRYLYLRNIGRLKLYLSRPIEGRIKTIDVKRTSTGKWFVSFSCDDVEPRQFPATDKSVGIDVGIKSFAVDSDGIITPNPLFLKQSLKQLRVRNRSLSRKVKGSNRRKTTKLQVAKLHEKVVNQRKDFLHKTANYYINNYKYIAVEDLNVAGMIRNPGFSRSISDSSWGLFFQLLSDKAAEADRILVKVNPYNTSQLCSNCGRLVPKLLSERTHSCPHCGLVLDRDENAARNIKQQMLGQSMQTSTSTLEAVCGSQQLRMSTVEY